MSVQGIRTRNVCDGDVAVALQGQDVHVGASSVPSAEGLHSIQIYVLAVVISGKDVVNPKSGFIEMFAERLRKDRNAGTCCHE